MNICNDCKWCTNNTKWFRKWIKIGTPTCMHKSSLYKDTIETDEVTGDQRWAYGGYANCKYMRWSGDCGQKGIHFEPKDL